MARSGRGRLSSMDLLPVEAEEDVVWAHSQLRERKKTQGEILEQFNLRLKLKQIPTISMSAFNRASMRLNRMATRLEEARQIASVLANRFEEGSDEQLTLLVGETIKMIVFSTLEKIDDPEASLDTAEMLMNLSRTLKHAEEAKRISADTRTKIEREFLKRAEDAVEKVAKAKGLSAETRDNIRSEILGIRKA